LKNESSVVRYLISLMLDPVIGCSTASLRALSAGAICLIFFTSYVILRNHRSPTSAAAIVKDDQKEVSEKTSHEDQSVILDAHTAFNIALFPPLFFFSALYYTDVPSTLVVLLTYSAFTKRGIGSWGILDEIRTVLMGVMALLFRQTNIFWVAVFPAGLTVIRTFKRKGNLAKASPMSPSDALSRSWNEGRVYDMPVCDAGIQGQPLAHEAPGVF
jgi:alpha-1,2-glucosyltransferase